MMVTTMTVAGVVGSGITVMSAIGVLLGIAIAIPLGLRVAGWVKRMVTR